MFAYRRTVFTLTLTLVLSLIGPLATSAAAPPAQADNVITYNVMVTGQIFDNDEEDIWVFNGQAGELVLIDMRAIDPDLDTYLTLTDATGNTLMTDDDGGEGYNSRIGPYTLPDNGEYTIIAGRYGGMGAYSLELTNLSTVPTIALNKPLVGVVNADQPSNYFLLDNTNNEELAMWRVEVQDDQLYSDPVLSVLGTGGVISSNELQDDTSYLDPVVPLIDELRSLWSRGTKPTPADPTKLSLPSLNWNYSIRRGLRRARLTLMRTCSRTISTRKQVSRFASRCTQIIAFRRRWTFAASITIST